MGKLFRRKFKDRKTGKTCLSPRWYADYRDAHGVRVREPLSTDKTASMGMLADITRKVERQKAGISDPTDDHMKVPLSRHLADWDKSLISKGVGEGHRQLVTDRAREIIAKSKAVFLADVSASRVMDAVADIATEKQHSAQTKAHHVQAVKQFGRWLLKDRRWSVNPLAFLAVPRAAIRADKKHERRAFSVDELKWLFDTTNKGPIRHHLSGVDRSMLYRIAVYTGLRREELSTLKPANFRDGWVSLAASKTKNSTEAVIPIPTPLWDDLAHWLRSKKSDRLLFGEPLAGDLTHFSKMLKKDMAAARTARLATGGSVDDDFLVWQDAQGRFADGHALRATYVTLLAKSGASIKEVQTLARHADAKTTLVHYAKVNAHDLTAAVSRLPSVPLTSEVAAAEATGTDSAVPKLCQNSDTARHSETLEDSFQAGPKNVEPSRKQAVSSRKPALHPVGFEPTTPGLGNQCSIP